VTRSESKYFNTAVKMDEALLSLLEKKEFSYITVKEICEKAGVNRSTFYLHYENTADLLKETTQHVLDRFLSYFPKDGKNITVSSQNENLNSLIFITPEYLTPYLTFIRDNQRIFKTAVKELGAMGFDKVYQRMFSCFFDPLLARFDFPENTRSYVMKFYLSGITAIAMEWLADDCADGIDTVIAVITDCVLGKIKFYEQNS